MSWHCPGCCALLADEEMCEDCGQTKPERQEKPFRVPPVFPPTLPGMAKSPQPQGTP